MSGTAIINFYNDMVRLVIYDLEQEVVAKARGLFQGLIKSSNYYDVLLAHFRSAGYLRPKSFAAERYYEDWGTQVKWSGLGSDLPTSAQGAFAKGKPAPGPRKPRI
jgi:hypothetical protein